MSCNNRGAVLERENVPHALNISSQRCMGKLRRGHVISCCLKTLNDAAPTGAVCPCTMYQNDIRRRFHFSSSSLCRNVRSDEATQDSQQYNFSSLRNQ